jgi:hypothetical protein
MNTSADLSEGSFMRHSFSVISKRVVCETLHLLLGRLRRDLPELAWSATRYRLNMC